MDNTVVGIHDIRLQELSVEVLDYKDKISEIFDKLDNCLDRLPNSYTGEPCTRLMEKYEAIKQQYAPVKTSIKNYADDLSHLVQKMHENDRYLAGLFQQSSIQEINKKTNFDIENDNNDILN